MFPLLLPSRLAAFDMKHQLRNAILMTSCQWWPIIYVNPLRELGARSPLAQLFGAVLIQFDEQKVCQEKWGHCNIGPLRRIIINLASIEKKEALKGKVPFIRVILSGVPGKFGISWLIGTWGLGPRSRLRITTNPEVARSTFEFRILAFKFQNLIKEWF